MLKVEADRDHAPRTRELAHGRRSDQGEARRRAQALQPSRASRGRPRAWPPDAQCHQPVARDEATGAGRLQPRAAQTGVGRPRKLRTHRLDLSRTGWVGSISPTAMTSRTFFSADSFLGVTMMPLTRPASD